MKTCLLCGHDARSDAETCANCGEGSWSASREEKPAESAPVADPVADPEPESAADDGAVLVADPEPAAEPDAKTDRRVPRRK